MNKFNPYPGKRPFQREREHQSTPAALRDSGACKWFDAKKGYGFIAPDAGGADVFVHVSQLQKTGLEALVEGDRISYTLKINKGKPQATEIRLES